MGPRPSVFDLLANLTSCLQTRRKADFIPQTSGRTLVSGLQPGWTRRGQKNWGEEDEIGGEKKVAGFQSIWRVVFQRLQILNSHLSCYCRCSSQWRFFLFWHLTLLYAFTPLFSSQKDILILKEKCARNQSCGFQTSCLASSRAREVFVEWIREWMKWFSRKSYEESLPLAKVGLFFFQKLGIIT